MRRTKNDHGATLGDCSVRSTTEGSLFSMMSSLPAEELRERISDIRDQDTRVLARAFADALTDDWVGPIKV